MEGKNQFQRAKTLKTLKTLKPNDESMKVSYSRSLVDCFFYRLFVGGENTGKKQKVAPWTQGGQGLLAMKPAPWQGMLGKPPRFQDSEVAKTCSGL